MEHIYLFSGLGADHRVFMGLDFSGYEVTHIKWIPNQKNESLEHYASRLVEQMKSDEPTLIGLSFGGIIAVEIAKLIKTKRVILLASVKTFKELPKVYRIFAPLNLHRLLPNWLLVRSNFIVNWLFGTESKPDRILLSEILRDTDPVFLKWALGKISNWKNIDVHGNLKHIHGTADRIFPFKFVKCDFPIDGGGHFMTVNKTAELSKIIRQILTVK